MAESEAEKGRQLEQFREKYEAGFIELLELQELTGWEGPFPPDPSSMGVDGRTLEELSREELGEAREIIYRHLGINPAEEGVELRTYTTKTHESARVPGNVEVHVLKTNIEDVYLQEMIYEDHATRWVIGPDQNI